MKNYKEIIYNKIKDGLSPDSLEVLDESEKHLGHAGYREGGQTHFKVIVVAPVFSGQSRVARQRMVYDLLKQELEERVHALSITARAPGEELN